MRYTLFMILLTCPLTLAFGEDTAVQEEPENLWVKIITLVVSSIVIPFLVKFLNKKSDESKKKAEKAEIESDHELVNLRNDFIDKRLIPFLYQAAAHVSENRLPEILEDATNGDGFNWKQHLSDLKNELLELTKDKFATEGIDIVANVGEKYLDHLLDRALSKAIPFLPKVARPIAKEQGDNLTDKLSEIIMDKGLEYAKKWMDSEESDKEAPKQAAPKKAAPKKAAPKKAAPKKASK